jgi:hypothetical protein
MRKKLQETNTSNKFYIENTSIGSIELFVEINLNFFTMCKIFSDMNKLADNSLPPLRFDVTYKDMIGHMMDENVKTLNDE